MRGPVITTEFLDTLVHAGPYIEATCDPYRHPHLASATLSQRRWALHHALTLAQWEANQPGALPGPLPDLRPSDVGMYPHCEVPAEVLIDPGFVQRYLQVSTAGWFRSRGHGSQPSASTRVRANALRAYARTLGMPTAFAGLPRATPVAHWTPPVTPIVDELLAIAGHPGALAVQVRTAAFTALACVCPPRLGVLVGLRVTALRVTTIVYSTAGQDPTQPPAHTWANGPMVVDWGCNIHPQGCPIPATYAAALRRWLAIREPLVAHRGGTGELWVSLAANHTRNADGSRRVLPGGIAMQERGLTRAYSHAIKELNAHNVGRTGFPLPTRFGALRAHLRATQHT